MLYNIFNKADTFKVVVNFILFALFCICSLLLLLSVAAIAITKIDFAYSALDPVTSAIVAISAAFSGFVASRLFKENGLIWGISAGIVISAFIIAAALYTDSFKISSVLLTKIVISVVAGAMGGILGVNTN